MNEVSGSIQHLRPYLVVAAVFLIIGIGIGMNIGGREPPPYEPPVYTEPTTPEEEPDLLLPIFAGVICASIAMIVVYIQIRRAATSYSLK